MPIAETLIGVLALKAGEKLYDDVLEWASKPIKDKLSVPEREAAIKRCIVAGMEAFIGTGNFEREEDASHFTDVLGHFLKKPRVVSEFEKLLREKAPDIDELEYLVSNEGMEPEGISEIDFKTGFEAFVQAYLSAIKKEPALQGEIQISKLEESIRLSGILVEKVEEQNEVLDQIEKNTAVLSQEGAQFISGYLKSLLERCNRVELSEILDEVPEKGNELKLTDIYANLYLEGVQVTGSSDLKEVLLHRESFISKGPDQEERRHVTAIEAIAALDRVVVLGKPGGGKTTLVRNLVSQLVHRKLGLASREETMQGWGPHLLLPVHIVLRQFASWIPEERLEPSESLVWDYLDEICHQWGCKEIQSHLKREILEGRAIIFFDGLDEVAEKDAQAKRSVITETIRLFSSQIESKVVITCRTYAYTKNDAWRLDEVFFPIVTLADLNPEQIEAFLKVWYKNWGPLKGWEKEKQEAEAALLNDQISKLDHLRNLAETPLILTLMAQVHARTGLPNNRADLYDKAVNLLLARWENRLVRDEIGTADPGMVMRFNIPLGNIRTVLAEVAYEAHQNQESQENRSQQAANIPRYNLLKTFEERLEIDIGEAGNILAYIQERAGLIQAQDQDTFSFPHRTFQEYLAATHFHVESDATNIMIEALNRDLQWWREVFLLWAGTMEQVTSLSYAIERIVPVDDELDEKKIRKLEIVAQAMWETKFLTAQKREASKKAGPFTRILKQVQQELLEGMTDDSNLDAVLRSNSGTALGRLGDPRDEVLTIEHMPFSLIPAGKFDMGLPDDDSLGNAKGENFDLSFMLGEHETQLTYDFWMARYPVSVGQFRQYLEETGSKPEDPDCLKAPDNHPVVWVSWKEAMDYATWAQQYLVLHREQILASREIDKTFGKTLRELAGGKWRVSLPGSAEWERAARGPSGEQVWAFSGEFDPNKLNAEETGIKGTSPLGAFPGGDCGFGVEELSGNVWEWCRDWFKDDYAERKGKLIIDPVDPSEGNRRVVRGGSFDFNRDGCRCAVRGNYSPGSTATTS